MSERLKSVEEGLRSTGEKVLPYRGYVLGASMSIGALLLRLRYPHKIIFYASANCIPQQVFSKTAHNYRGKVTGYRTSDGLMVCMVHRPNWNPLYRHRKEETQVLLTGIQNVSPQASALLKDRLIGREVSIDIVGRNVEQDAVEAWVWIRYRLRKTSLSHLLIRKGFAQLRPIPCPGYSQTAAPDSYHSQTLLKLAEAAKPVLAQEASEVRFP